MLMVQGSGLIAIQGTGNSFSTEGGGVGKLIPSYKQKEEGMLTPPSYSQGLKILIAIKFIYF